jgi:hypothetical protein
MFLPMPMSSRSWACSFEWFGLESCIQFALELSDLLYSQTQILSQLAGHLGCPEN